MKRFIAAITLVVPDYDLAIEFYVGKLGFALIEDTKLSDSKRWVLAAPTADSQCRLLFAKADGEIQQHAIGNQTGGRVFLFLETDDFARDHARFIANGVRFDEAPRHEDYGTVAVFEDAFGNKWDLIERR
jgi:catechol 2,3-dioxygenase-like lactoylglutathione lyase family enzyme